MTSFQMAGPIGSKLLRMLHLHAAVLVDFRLGRERGRHRIAAMTGAAGDGLVHRLRIRIVDLRHELRIDVLRHSDHGAGKALVFLGIGCEVELVRLLVHCMAEGALHAQRLRKAAHLFDQVFRGDVLGQHL